MYGICLMYQDNQVSSMFFFLPHFPQPKFPLTSKSATELHTKTCLGRGNNT